MQTGNKVFSYTAIKQFEQCPRQYKEVKLEKRYPYQQTEEAAWGEYVHAQLEAAIMLGEPLADNVSQYQPLIDAVNYRKQQGWRVICETDFAIYLNGEAVLNTNADDLWYSPKNQFAGYIDLLMISPDGSEALIADWKTNKSSKYADPKQLDLYALGVLSALPDVQRVTAGLIFICDGYRLVMTSYSRDDKPRLSEEWRRRAQRLALAIVNNNFPESDYTPLCGWCPCHECPNWQAGQDYRARRNK